MCGENFFKKKIQQKCFRRNFNKKRFQKFQEKLSGKRLSEEIVQKKWFKKNGSGKIIQEIFRRYSKKAFKKVFGINVSVQCIKKNTSKILLILRTKF
jgi:hypothetical protein